MWYLKALLYFYVLLISDGVFSLKWSKTYHLKATLNIPSAGIHEPYQVWMNGNTKSGRVDFYGGMDKIFRKVSGNKAMYYKVYPETTEKANNEISCEEMDGGSLQVLSYAVNSYLPERDFKFVDNETFDNVPTQKWEYVATTDKENKATVAYTVWVTFGQSSQGSHVPVPKRYEYRIIVDGNEYDYFRHDYEHYDDSIVSDDNFDLIKNYKCKKVEEFNGPVDPLVQFVDPNLEDQHIHQEFERFKLKHGKKYEDSNEHFLRKNIFKNNLRYIHSVNRQHNSYTLGVNHLADLSEEEFAVFSGTIHRKWTKTNLRKKNRFVGGDDDPDHRRDGRGIVKENKFPESFDWRDRGAITPIKDQTLLCGSCYAFTTAAALESAAYVSRGCKHLDELSEQVIVDCTWSDEPYRGNLGCSGGNYENALDWIETHGIPTRKEYGPYLAQEGFCHLKNMTKLMSLKGHTELSNPEHYQIKKILYKKGPMMASINITPRSMAFYKKGVYDDSKCRSEEMYRNHGVTLIGYGNEAGKDYWLVKNSWSEMWGEAGYMKLAADYNICGLTNFLNYPIFEKNRWRRCHKNTSKMNYY